MSEINAGIFKKEEGGSSPELIGKTELTSPYFMVPPSGNIASRPQGCSPGTLRFNTDIGSLEYFKGDGLGWETINRVSPSLGKTGTGSNTGVGARGIFYAGQNPSEVDTIDYITISTLGNAIDFGDCVTALYLTAGCASSTRMVSGGGMVAPSITNAIEYVEIMTTGNAVDFGDLTQKRRHLDSCSNAHGGL